MATDLTTRLRRDVGIYRAAQVLYDADRVRAGLPPQPLTACEPLEREWFKQTARHMVEAFEAQTVEAADRPAQVDARATESMRLAQAARAQMDIERSRAAADASERGHELGTWHPTGNGREAAICGRCARVAQIDMTKQPTRFGAALEQGCITDATAPAGEDI